ncbi:hypothetical protein GIJ60_14695 [Klebsiella quasipneumoniae]|uniref:hypothetical protein n=1 Tax=Klebsiella quasipneumoniae TaxID=1463165 RepID=UPI0012997068|nr:hypothetical protein [Klebsiella quasipneumoniae]MRE40057.1 hypothetical protein [Klebsiella quasipneumoniae]MRF89287.1 hypothetical protein [Klebsiella quasipneumoniae]
MGSISITPPINEGVSLLNTLSPESLHDFRKSLPELSEELEIGRIGGITSSDGSLNKLRAEILIKALDIALGRANTELEILKNRMTSARKFRLGSQVLSLICSSGVLGAIAIGDKNTTVITAILSLLASLGVIFAEYKERLLKQGDGDVYIAFEAAGQAAYKAGVALENIKLLSSHANDSEELKNAIAESNKICEDLNIWLIKISGSA